MTLEPTRFRWWYESVIDWMLQNPDKTLKDCAAAFSVTPVWIYTLTKSKVFREELEKRREMHNLMLSTSVIEKTEAVADMALDLMAEKLHTHGDVLPIKTVADIADMALSHLGYTKSAPPGAAPGTVVEVSVELLDEARAKLRVTQATMTPPLPPTLPSGERNSAPVIDGALALNADD